MKPTQKKSTFRLSARPLGAALIALLLVGVGALLAQYAVWHTRQSTAAELARLLGSDRPEVREAAAEQLKDLGREGVAPLVQALLDERQPVFGLACDTIDQSLVSWQFLTPAEADRCRATLTEQLRQVIDLLPTERRFAARRWAEQIAAERFTSHSVDSARMLADCEAILRNSPVQTTVVVSPRATRTAKATQQPARPSAVDLSVTEPNAYRDAATTPPPQSETAVVRPAASPVPPAEPEAPAQEPQRLVAPAAEPLAPRQLTLTRSPPPRVPEKPVDQPVDFSEQADLEVMHRLHESDPRLGKDAETELRRRGYRRVDLPLCRALTDPDPTVRRQLVEALPTIQGINARPWLLQLAEDADADVRQAAEGILSASGDRSSLRKLR